MRRWLAAAAALYLAGATTARADETESLPSEVRVEDVLRLLRERSPRLRNEEAAESLAAADKVGAGLLPNPNLSYGNLSRLSGANTIDGSQHQVTLGMPLLLWGQRAARMEAAERRLEAAHEIVRSRYDELALHARELFIDLLADRESQRSLEETQQELERASEIARAREASGLARRYDVVKVSIEKSANDARLADARAEYDSAAGELATWLGFPGWRPEPVGELRPMELAPDLDSLWREAESHSPALLAAHATEAAARAGEDSARRERWPVPTVIAGANITTNEPSTNAVAGVSIDLPVLDHGQGKLARAEAESLAAQHGRELTVASTRAELERDVRLLSGRRAALASFEEHVSGDLPVLRQMAEDAYKSGQGGVIDLIDAIRSRADLRLERIALLHEVMTAEVETLATAGRVEALTP